MNGDRFQELSEAMSTLSWSHPFWSSLIYDRLQMKVTDKIPTAATDGRNIFINKEFFIEKCDGLERIFALAHETGHCMFMHPEKWKHYLAHGFDGEPFDMNRMNIAADFVINAMLVHTKVGKIKHHNPPQPGDWLLAKDVLWTDSVEEVYRRLKPPEMPSQPQSGDGDDDGGGQEGTSEGPEGGSQMPQGGQPGQWTLEPHPDRGKAVETFDAPKTQDTHIAMDATVSELEWKTSVEAAAIGAKSMGKFPADMEILVKEFTEVKRDWKQELRDYFIRHKGRDKRNWKRGNKRKMHFQGIFVPKRHSWKIGPTLIIEDWSGSISADESGWFRGTMMAILTDCRPKELRVMGVTTRVCEDEYLKTPAELGNWERTQSGCTDMEAGFRKVIEEGWMPEVAVVLTDGYTDFTDPPPFPVIWVTTGLAPEDFPYGRAVLME